MSLLTLYVDDNTCMVPPLPRRFEVPPNKYHKVMDRQESDHITTKPEANSPPPSFTDIQDNINNELYEFLAPKDA
jgi:hypothetical protein